MLCFFPGGFASVFSLFARVFLGSLTGMLSLVIGRLASVFRGFACMLCLFCGGFGSLAGVLSGCSSVLCSDCN